MLPCGLSAKKPPTAANCRFCFFTLTALEILPNFATFQI